MHGKHRINVEEKKPREELAASRPRSGTRPPLPGPGGPSKPFGRESYSPRGGGRGGAPSHNGGGSFPYSGGRGGGGRDNGGGGAFIGGRGGGHNGSGVYSGGTSGFTGGAPTTGGRNYTRSCSSDDGRAGPPPPGPQR